MPAKLPITPGTQYNYLTIIEQWETRNSCIHVVCRCVCWKIKEYNHKALRVWNTKSCWCVSRAASAKRLWDRLRTHWLTNSREFEIWHSMKLRCYLKTNDSYHRYGGRGITVCDRWIHSFENFLCDMGKRPSSEYSIDRIDVNGNYEPSNCKWSTRYEQWNNKTNNRRFKWKTIAELSRETWVNYYTLWNRVERIEKKLQESVDKEK